jgi:3'-phosphoadenosine 5'-phosphosulfate sulfotransferase (PAPS reductase)/FAD synthetase
MQMSSYKLSYLKNLEAESIHILREVVAEFKKPVMLYSAGKDSSVMVRLAQKAFYPGKFPFPLMHIDTGFKFPEMYSFRKLEEIPIVPIYYARERDVVSRNGILIPLAACTAGGQTASVSVSGEKVTRIMCRFRSLGCIPCTGAIASQATTIDEIIGEVRTARKSERENRIIDLTSDSSMEQKKREGYF